MCKLVYVVHVPIAVLSFFKVDFILHLTWNVMCKDETCPNYFVIVHQCGTLVQTEGIGHNANCSEYALGLCWAILMGLPG